MHGCWHKEWRSHSYALYPRGRRRKLEPLTHILRMLPRQSVVHSNTVSRKTTLRSFPLAHKSNYSKSDFLRLFGKVRNNKPMHRDLGFLPKHDAKVYIVFQIPAIF